MPIASIQVTTDRFVIPREVIDSEIIAVQTPVYWAFVPEERAAYVSQHREVFDDDRFQLVGDTVVQQTRVTAIPAAFFSSMRGESGAVPGFGLFTNGDKVEFELRPNERMCRLTLV